MNFTELRRTLESINKTLTAKISIPFGDHLPSSIEIVLANPADNPTQTPLKFSHIDMENMTAVFTCEEPI